MKRIALALIATILAGPAFAHLNPAEHGSLAAGLSHPLVGLDHILAMVAVGLWATMLGGRSLWLVPGAFVGAMILGFAAAMSGLTLPFVEPVIGASVIVVGLAAAVALRVPAPAGMALVGFFAFFHGYAHGGELGEAGALPFMAGFAMATAALHAAGLGLGIGFAKFAAGGSSAARVAGALTALAGVWLMAGA